MLQALVTDTQGWHVWQVNTAPLLLRWQRGDWDIDATEERLVTKLNILSVLVACMLASHFLIFLGRHQQAQQSKGSVTHESLLACDFWMSLGTPLSEANYVVWACWIPL